MARAENEKIHVSVPRDSPRRYVHIVDICSSLFKILLQLIKFYESNLRWRVEEGEAEN